MAMIHILNVFGVNRLFFARLSVYVLIMMEPRTFSHLTDIAPEFLEEVDLR